MSPERSPQAERHPADVVFDKLGLPEGFGDMLIPEFYGREIVMRDYFFQPETDERAQALFAALHSMDPSDPRFITLKAGFMRYAETKMPKK